MCELKLWSRLYSVKAQGGPYLQIAYRGMSCDKRRGCGYEENTSGETMVSKLRKRLSLNCRKGKKDGDVQAEQE